MIDEIMKEFENKAVHYHYETMFHAQDAIQIIQKCREKNKKILGIDTFKVDPPGIQPMDYIDYSGGNYEDFDPEEYFQKYHIKKNTDSGRWADAIQFVFDRANRGWLFDIVYEGRNLL